MPVESNLFEPTHSLQVLLAALGAAVKLVRFVRLDDERHVEVARPDKLVLVLPAVQAVTKPDAPHDVKVGTNTGHEVPVSS